MCATQISTLIILVSIIKLIPSHLYDQIKESFFVRNHAVLIVTQHLQFCFAMNIWVPLHFIMNHSFDLGRKALSLSRSVAFLVGIWETIIQAHGCMYHTMSDGQ